MSGWREYLYKWTINDGNRILIRLNKIYEASLNNRFKISLKKALKENLPKFDENLDKVIVDDFLNSCDDSIEEFAELSTTTFGNYMSRKLFIGSTNTKGRINIPEVTKDSFVFVTPISRPYDPDVNKLWTETTAPQQFRRVSVGSINVSDGQIQILTNKTGNFTIFVDDTYHYFDAKYLIDCFVQVVIVTLNNKGVDDVA